VYVGIAGNGCIASNGCVPRLPTPRNDVKVAAPRIILRLNAVNKQEQGRGRKKCSHGVEIMGEMRVTRGEACATITLRCSEHQ